MLRFRYVGKLPEPIEAAQKETASWWFDGHAYRGIQPLQHELLEGTLWGWFPTDKPSPGVSPLDVLTDHRAVERTLDPKAEVGWNPASLTPGTMGGVTTQWMGRVPADRMDWVPFAVAIPLTPDPTQPLPTAVVATIGPLNGEVVPLVAVFHRLSLAAVGLPATLRIGEWAPAFSNDGKFARHDGSFAFVWTGDPVTERDRANETSATFWYEGHGYSQRPTDLLPPTASTGSLRGLFVVPRAPPMPGSDLSPREVLQRNARTSGSWDAPVRLDANRAVVTWHGPLPCERSHVNAFLRQCPAVFDLEGSAHPVQELHDSCSLPEVVIIDGPRIFGVFHCRREPKRELWTALHDIIIGPSVRGALPNVPAYRPRGKCVMVESVPEPVRRAPSLLMCMLILVVIAILVAVFLREFRNCWRSK